MAVGHERGLERRHGGVIAGLQQQLGAVGVVARRQREPAVLAKRDVPLDLKTELAGIERARFGLVVHKIAGDVDPRRR